VASGAETERKEGPRPAEGRKLGAAERVEKSASQGGSSDVPKRVVPGGAEEGVQSYSLGEAFVAKSIGSGLRGHQIHAASGSAS